MITTGVAIETGLQVFQWMPARYAASGSSGFSLFSANVDGSGSFGAKMISDVGLV
ncbi:hypothetical protein [Streptomyces sp. NPDC020571]|uniref:hypothetical protein n=1 Tax=Streptomyces sp. NPDC020571 TaxID=3365079 RepID=UPI00379FAED8